MKGLSGIGLTAPLFMPAPLWAFDGRAVDDAYAFEEAGFLRAGHPDPVF